MREFFENAAAENAMDAVLIANTYHEFTQPRAMLQATWKPVAPPGEARPYVALAR